MSGCHHHHHVVPLAQISLTLSRHFSLSLIASGMSSRLHPVSSHSCCMYVRAARPAFARYMSGSIGVTHLRARPCFSNNLLKTYLQNTWITGTLSHGLMRWRLICLVLMASSMCGGDQVRSTKISVSCLQSSIVVGMLWSWAALVLQVLESYISLRKA